MSFGEGFALPPDAKPWSDFHWFSASPKGDLVLVMLGDQPVWYLGHYVGGRMAACVGSGCDYCATGIGSQVRFCMSCAEVATRRTGLIEFGKGNGEMIGDWARRQGTLRGLVIEVSKHTKSRQSRTEVRHVSSPAEPWFLPLEVPDIALALYLTWQKAGLQIPQALKEHAELKLQERRMRAMEREPVGRKAW